MCKIKLNISRNWSRCLKINRLMEVNLDRSSRIYSVCGHRTLKLITSLLYRLGMKYLPSYHSSTNNKAFIVTHYPPPEDAVDFLRLLTDHESQVVVCMDPLTNVASSKNWLPRMGCSLSVSPFTVHCKQEEITKFKCTTVDIVRNGMNNETCSVVIVEPIYNLKSSGEPGGGIGYSDALNDARIVELTYVFQ
ncbi:uncharacterized protein LOC130049114 isoform X2 [Ostrea edulis]|uniref:uncharacterized protein LOC130049114 isoform X2 n=1 Tax=Ostrea edulis TaxID=37623 RepID=UPI0024AEF4A0|nr:uncharacterized protein LOC130049114 isoform X2 [Ostrea edulis]XP_056002300.1 uncharacterized protein LOC130049114 isoform X2 [Ostrea edulis]